MMNRSALVSSNLLTFDSVFKTTYSRNSLLKPFTFFFKMLMIFGGVFNKKKQISAWTYGSFTFEANVTR